MRKDIGLGDKLKDVVTGFTGIATGYTAWLNGCVRYALQGKKMKDGNPSDLYWVDEAQLKLVKKNAVAIVKDASSDEASASVSEPPGGPTPSCPRRTTG